jgi:outer membrane protein OmpA-like peptidoglycan-associated protein
MQRAIVLSVALLAFGLLCFYCVTQHSSMIQQDVSGHVVQALAANHVSSQAVRVDGRDVLLTGPANSVQISEATQKLAAAAEGVRLVSVRATDAQPDASTVTPAPTAAIQAESQAKLDTLLEQNVVEFNPSSAELTAQGRAVLDQVAPVLLASPASNCEIQGHTDSQGNADANRDLSYRRAIATKNYLVNKGIAPERLTTAGYGDTKPIASNDTPDGRRKNRRINFVLKGKE